MTDAIQRIKQLDQERLQLLNTAKKEALERVSEAIEDLKALGFNYRVVGDESGRSPRVPAATRQVKDEPCPVCKFKTTPPHDGRKHRGQGKRKKPFTAAELQEFGLART